MRLTPQHIENAAQDDTYCGEFTLDYTDIPAVRKLARLARALANALLDRNDRLRTDDRNIEGSY